MPKLACVCGFIHDLSPIPDRGYRTIRDRDYDEHRDDLRAALSCDLTAVVRTKHLWGRLYECPECGRLAWLHDGGDTAQFFTPEPLPEDAP